MKTVKLASEAGYTSSKNLHILDKKDKVIESFFEEKYESSDATAVIRMLEVLVKMKAIKIETDEETLLRFPELKELL